MPDKDININLNVNSDKYQSNIKKAEKNTEEFNKKLKDTAKTAEKAEKEIKDISKAVDKLGKSAKVGKLGLEALKDNLGSIPVIGSTATRALDGIDGSLLSIAKAALPVAGVAGGIAAIGGAAVLAYANSDKLQESIGRLGTEVIDLGTNLPIFESIGDAVAVVTDGIADTIHNINILNGTALANTRKVLDEINNSQININKQEDIAIEKAKAKGASEEEILRIRKQYAEMRIDTSIDNKSIAPDEYNKQNDIYNDLHKKREKLLKQQNQFDKNNALEAESYYNLQTEIDRYTKLLDEQSIVRNQALEANKKNNEILAESIGRYKELNAVEGVRSTDKIKIDELEKLLKKRKEILQVQKYEDELVNKIDAKALKENELKDLSEELSIQKQVYYEKRKRNQLGEEEKKRIEEIIARQKKLNEETKATALKWHDIVSLSASALSSIGSMASALISLGNNMELIDLAPFNKAIEEAKSKLNAFNKWKEETEEAEKEKSLEDYKERLSRLDEEIEYAKAIGDKMSEIALENKKKEIQKEMEEEQKRLDKEKAINEEEKRLQQELAIAEYNKEYANWQNQVKQAEASKQQSVANATLSVAQSALQGAQAYATALGPPPYGLGILGHIPGAAAMASIIASAATGASSVKNASSVLDNIRSSPPEPPQFQYGTDSYNLSAGESILVGEVGPELLSLKSGGNIAVESNAQVKAKGLLNNGGMYIDKIIFNVNKVLNEEEIYKAMNNYKQRNSFMYTR